MIQFDGSHIFQMGWENNHQLVSFKVFSALKSMMAYISYYKFDLG